MDLETENRKKHIAQIVQVVNEILGGQTKVLQRIEEGYGELNHVYSELLNKLTLLEKKVDGGFTVLETNGIAPLHLTISDKLQKLEYNYLKKLKTRIDSIHTKLQQQMQMQIFQLLIKKSQEQEVKPLEKLESKVKSVEKEKVTSPKTPLKVTASQRPSVPTTPSTVPPPSQPPLTSELAEDDLSESELEGAQLYDTLIVGWKRRDWEALKGTKEIFSRGWKKLSMTDRQKIKNGAWSKPLMEKLKLLGRE